MVRHGLLALICLSFTIAAAHAQKPKSGDPVIGKLNWQISDGANKVLSKGVKVLHLNDVELRLRPRMGPAMAKRLALGDHFYIEVLSMHNATGHPNGFSITADRDDVHTNCFEWFNIQEPGHAKKMDETGDISYELSQTQFGWEITHMSFLSDVSIRVLKSSGPPKPKNIGWRVKIGAGSTIDWPYLVDKKPVTKHH